MQRKGEAVHQGPDVSVTERSTVLLQQVLRGHREQYPSRSSACGAQPQRKARYVSLSGPPTGRSGLVVGVLTGGHCPSIVEPHRLSQARYELEQAKLIESYHEVTRGGQHDPFGRVRELGGR